ncbi:MAG TPA: type VI secretion system accessory protein TagJ [Deltaproteobacteria bacterium]|nr:type VI secretion system accessory protein TagJ [Deltaproteobacteria bacterium]HOM28865.1 type VI secretion system accessory protein TagJ [Deltaproteobacteria bacterium]HPP80960.1 type VI secretion system accessory protein TagJ [Deltaproteobacteria bacterium]
MTVKELIREARLGEARSVLIEEVKQRPGDTRARTLLFQVLALLGEWEKAARHLEMIAPAGGAHAGVSAFMDITKAELERREVIGEWKAPPVVPGVPPYIEEYLAYLDALKERDETGARELLGRIDSARPRVSGTINGEPFSDFTETDARLYAFLEAFVHDRYVWVPFEAIREIVLAEPASSFDLIWAGADIVTWEGLSLRCYLPVTYPDTSSLGDDEARLGRKTTWERICGGLSMGVGQHVYQAGDREVALLDIRTGEFTMEVEGHGGKDA